MEPFIWSVETDMGCLLVNRRSLAQLFGLPHPSALPEYDRVTPTECTQKVAFATK